MKNKKQNKKSETKKIKGKSEIGHSQWYFLMAIVIFCLIIFLINPNAFEPSFKSFLSLLQKIIPIILVIFVLMFLVDLLITPKLLVDYLGKGSKSIFGWPIAIIGGIISTGPIYMWYPLLSDLQKKGVKNGFIATFLYNRAIKPALIPLIIFYFGVAFTIVLTIVIVIASVFQGLIIEKIVGGNKK